MSRDVVQTEMEMEAVEYSCSCPFSKMVVAVGRRLGAMAAAVKAQEEIYWCGDESRVEVKQLAGSPAQPSPPPLLSLLMMMTSPTMANPFASCPRVFALRSVFFFFCRFSRLCDDLDESFPPAGPRRLIDDLHGFQWPKGRRVRPFKHLAICLVDDISGVH